MGNPNGTWAKRRAARTAATLFVLGLLLPSPVSADWLQEGGDAAGTGNTNGSAPTWDDVALELRLPQQRRTTTMVVYPLPAPIIIDRTAYVLVAQGPEAALNGFSSCLSPRFHYTLFAVSVDTGAYRNISALQTPNCEWPSMASDGTHLLVTAHHEVRAFSLADHTQVWSVHNEPQATPDAQADRIQDCPHTRIEAGRAYVGCMLRYGVLGISIPSLTVLNVSTGQVLGGPWLFPNTHPEDDNNTATLPGQLVGVSLYPYSFLTHWIAMPVRQGMVVMDLASEDPQANYDAPEKSFETAALTLINADPELQTLTDRDRVVWRWFLGAQTPEPTTNDDPLDRTAPALIVQDRVISKRINVNAHRIDGVESAASGNLRDGQAGEGDLGAGCAAVEEDVVCGFRHRLYRLDPNLGVRWRHDLAGGAIWAEGSLARSAGMIIGMPSALNGQPEVAAFDEATGTAVWSHSLPKPQTLSQLNTEPYQGGAARFAIGDGFIVAIDRSGLLTVIGTTSASPSVTPTTSTTYPSLAEAVRVDLSASESGPLGPIAAYRAEWGDGQFSDWQTSAVLTHFYSFPGDAPARFFVRTSKNQTASYPLTFHVGQADPSKNLINAPFSDRYQETSFFLLGLLATLLVAVFGILRASRKRRRLRRELRDLEAEFVRLNEDATACDAMLSRRRTRARGLYLVRKLEEAHSAFLVGRIDELRRNLRLGTVDARLKFLPHGMVLQLQRLLADGLVDEYEREHFVTALRHETSLSSKQKAEVAHLIDTWFARDASATRPSPSDGNK